MAPFIDARVPVRLGSPQGSAEGIAEEITVGCALLIEGSAPAPSGHPVARFVLPVSGHVVGCACCLPRGPVAAALSRLFQARARGEVAFFRLVLALPVGAAGAAAVRAALAEDVFVAARFRPA